MCDTHQVLMTEYQVINSWRANLVNVNYILTSICMAISLVIFATYLASTPIPSEWTNVFFVLSVGLIFFWRIFYHRNDIQILRLYERICKLEECLSINFTRKYLKSSLFKHMKYNPSWEVFSWSVKYENLSVWQKYFTRGHLAYNSIAIFIIFFESYYYYQSTFIPIQKWLIISIQERLIIPIQEWLIMQLTFLSIVVQ